MVWVPNWRLCGVGVEECSMSSPGLLLRSMEKGVFRGTWALVFRCLEIRDNRSRGGARLKGVRRNRLQRRNERSGAIEATVMTMSEACWCVYLQQSGRVEEKVFEVGFD